MACVDGNVPATNGDENRPIAKLSSRANAFRIEAIIAKHENYSEDECGKENDGREQDEGKLKLSTLKNSRSSPPIAEQDEVQYDNNSGCTTTVRPLPSELLASTDHKHPALKELDCTLEAKDLWKKFHELGTEMIITKTGRRMFPTIRVSFSGAATNSKYLVVMDIIPVDNKRYRYAYHKSSWLIAGKADPPVPHRLYFHNEIPVNDSQLSKQLCSFEKLKLTNNNLDRNGHVVLNSMHKYQPRIHVIRADRASIAMDCLQPDDYKTFVFPETQFTAVTAYQNQLITRLKIDSNPFAKGFRDSSRLNEYERDSVETLLCEGRIRPTGASTAMELFLDRRVPHLPVEMPKSNCSYMFPPMSQRSGPAGLMASQQYIHYFQRYHSRDIGLKMADQLQSPYLSRSKELFSSENAAKLRFRDIARLGYSGIVNMQNPISPIPPTQYQSILRHSSNNKERMLPILNSFRYQPYSTFCNAARIRQLYACLDAATPSKTARVLPE